jgi:hypothetical protein
MLTRDLRIEAKTRGSIFSLGISVEGEVVDLHREDGIFVKELPDFPIDNPLTVFVRAKGVTGAGCAVRVLADGHELDPPLVCTVKKGVAQVLHDYHV